MARNTTTGRVLEAMVRPALQQGRYEVEEQVVVGNRPGGRVHKADIRARIADNSVLISLKWQQTSGTAEQKVPFEVMCLADAVRAGHASRAVLVLGGDRWTLRDYYTSGRLADHLVHARLVRIVTLEAFVRLANNGQL